MATVRLMIQCQMNSGRQIGSYGVPYVTTESYARREWGAFGPTSLREWTLMFRKIRTFWLMAIPAMLAGTLATAAPVLANAGAAPANATENGFMASAYGTQVKVGTTVQSGRSAASTLGCTSSVGVTHSNTAASVNALVLTTGTIDTSVSSEATSTGFASTSNSTIQDVNALGGLV